MKLQYILIALVLLVGCTKDLDLTPKDTISDVTFWESSSDFKLAANNLYFSLETFDFWDVESDIAYNVPNPVSNGTIQTTETDDNWNSPYTFIRSCNKIITMAEESSVLEDEEVKRFVAEAMFFRAYNYWKLFKLYGRVQIITEVLDINSEELYGSRNTRKETVDFILDDLTNAVADLPEKSELSEDNIGRITKGAALALKARVALFEGTWQKYRGGTDFSEYINTAISAASEVMNSSQYSLYTGGAESYRYLFIDQGDNSTEGILDRRYQKDVFGQDFPHQIQQTGYLPTKKLADMYLCEDGLPISQSPLFQGYNAITSEFQNRDSRMTMTMMVPGTNAYQPLYSGAVENWPFRPQRNANTGYIMYKFMSENVTANMLGAGTGPHSFDYHIIRYAEVLLIYAEAIFERDGAISDGDLDKSINVIRQRVNMPALTNSFVSSHGLDMLEEIRRERTIELAMENFRYDDLRRWKTAETELIEDVKGIKIVDSEWAEPIIIDVTNENPYMDNSWQTDENGFIVAESNRVFDPNKHYLRPIPTKEVLLNPGLEQNPNW